MQEATELGEEEARIAIEAIREELVRRAKVAVIAVSDSHGELVSLLRMNGAPLPSIDVATRKALTAARKGRRPGSSDDNSRRTAGRWPTAMSGSPVWDGGIPVWHRNRLVGSVAVSGLDQSEDAEMARLGAARIIEKLGR